jgi:putative tricarboxylic transport membrane protein
MSEQIHSAPESGPRHRAVEVAVALLTAALGLIVIAGSLRVGIGWDMSGPKAGFFPFYVGLFIVVGSAINLFNAWTGIPASRLFATWGELRKVMSVVIPTGIYVIAVPLLGIYVSSILLIAVFMKWLGRYGWFPVLAISFGVPLLFFIVFERYFLIPLPKGPVEDFIGF